MYLQGELLDLEASPIEKMRLNLKWTLHKDGILNWEFFKWLNNCNEEDYKKLILHLLSRFGKKQIFEYSMVTMKQTSKVIKDFYSAKEWLEHPKRKRIVRRELKKSKSSFCLFNAATIFEK